MTESLRQYLTMQELCDYVDTDTKDELVLKKAEKDIDNAIAVFYQKRNRKSVYINYTLQSLNLTATNATTSELGNSDNFYSKMVLELLSGDDAGKRIFVNASSISAGVTTLTFLNSQSVTPASNIKAYLYQEAKLPRIADTSIIDSVYYKRTPDFLKEAVANQYKYRLDNPNVFETPFSIKKYEVDQASYSEEYNTDPKATKSIQSMISPQAWAILEDEGLTTQSMF